MDNNNNNNNNHTISTGVEAAAAAEDDVDDQGSGWLQVKKKHRSGSKFSLHTWVGTFSAKNNAYSQTKPHIVNSNNSVFIQDNNNNNNNNNTTSSNSPTTPPQEGIMDHQNACAITLKVDDPNEEKKPNRNPDVVHKIKWGDLDHCENGDVGAEINFGPLVDTMIPLTNKDQQIVVDTEVEPALLDDNVGGGSTSAPPVDDEIIVKHEVSAGDSKLSESQVVYDDDSSPAVNNIQPCEPILYATDDDPSKAQPLVEEDAAESKERFRERLWCFLFENLNRAVDELYLLCELECDLEQMKEAILVLQESASDFKDLTSRVAEFDNVRRSSPRSVDGGPFTLKTDHRRPHALSWEVRRMTTSPHRAEILSSSLEAFKKIQQERSSKRSPVDVKTLGLETSKLRSGSRENMKFVAGTSDVKSQGNNLAGRMGRSPKVRLVQSGCKISEAPTAAAKNRKEQLGSDLENAKKNRMLTESTNDKSAKSADQQKWKSMDAWKEKRDWKDILASPHRVSSRISHSPGLSRKSAERARTLHDKLMSPEKKKKSGLDLRKDAQEKHARAMRIRSELENERVQKLQRTSEKLNRVNEWQAVRNLKLREGMYARHQQSESRHEAHIAQVVKRAGDESSKVNEVRFITSLNEENKKLILRQKLQDSELRRAEKLQLIKTKQKEDMAREEAVVERRKLIEAEKLNRLAETQRRKEEAQVRREEERKASSTAREARALEQQRRKEERAKAQQEEAELLAQKLAERLSESEQRRKYYLEQIRERASMDFRDQSSPFLRRSVNKEGRSTPNNNGEDDQLVSVGNASTGNVSLQQSQKRRIKKIRQRLMALKYDFIEPSENSGIGYRASIGTARAKIGKWLQELKKLRQARKEGAASIGLIIAEMIRFLDGKEPEVQVSRQAGLLDFVASALPASHTSKPEACQVTLHFLKLLRVLLSGPLNRSYFIAQNLLPPVIPMLSAVLENYIKIAASLNLPGGSGMPCPSSKTSVEYFESVSEILDGFLWIVTSILGHVSSDERELQMRDGLLDLLIAYQVVHRLRELFALYDRPQVEGSPFPCSILLCINLLVVLTSRPGTSDSIDWESFPNELKLDNESQYTLGAEMPNGSTIAILPDVPEDRPLDESCRINKNDESGSVSHDNEKKPTDEKQTVHVESLKIPIEKDEKSLVHAGGEDSNGISLSLKSPVPFLLSAISETGLVSLPSLLTSVLLQANNRLSSEQFPYVLPSNFEEVATGVMKVLNNLAILDITFIQRMLARPDLKMEFFHLISFLISHCTTKWKLASDQVGLLLLESLSLLSYFALFHSGNQAVLRWGKSPTILHKVCDLPFVFFSDPDLMPILASTLVAACYGCEQNRDVVQQELSMDMLLSLLKSCRNVVPVVRSGPTLENISPDDSVDLNQPGSELRKNPGDGSLRSSRQNAARSTRASLGKGVPSGTSTRYGKIKSQRKISEESAQKHSVTAPEISLMLHNRFPSGFVDKAEQFFSANCTNVVDQIEAENSRPSLSGSSPFPQKELGGEIQITDQIREMESSNKQRRVRFSNPEDESGITQNRTVQSEVSKLQDWFWTHIPRPTSPEYDSRQSDLAVAVGAAAFSICSLEEAETLRRIKIREDSEQSRSRVARRSFTREVSVKSQEEVTGRKSTEQDRLARQPSRQASTRRTDPVAEDRTLRGKLSRQNGGLSRADRWERVQLEKIDKHLESAPVWEWRWFEVNSFSYKHGVVARYQKLKSGILTWENEKKMQAKVKMEKRKVELEERKKLNQLHYQNKVSRINHIAEGARKQAEEKRRSEESDIREKAKRIRPTGKEPVKWFCF
ncbi:hypothetical protein ACFE04_009720 [Oxalis oulophora]